MTASDYTLTAELRDEKKSNRRRSRFITYRERCALSHLDVVKSLDRRFGHKSVWNDDDGVWENLA